MPRLVINAEANISTTPILDQRLRNRTDTSFCVVGRQQTGRILYIVWPDRSSSSRQCRDTLEAAFVHLVSNLMDAEDAGPDDDANSCDDLGGVVVGIPDHRLVTVGLSILKIGLNAESQIRI